MEMDYSNHMHFRWKIKWRLDFLGALGIMGEMAPLIIVATCLVLCWCKHTHYTAIYTGSSKNASSQTWRCSLQNQNLRTDVRWVAKRIRKSARKFTQVPKFVNYTLVLASTCVGISARPKSLHVHASQRKWAAKRNVSWTQVEYLRRFASPFGQSFTFLWFSE